MVTEITPVQVSQRQEDAERVVEKYVAISAGIGLVPIPLVDQIGVAALLSTMINNIGEIYEVDIVKYRVKLIIIAVLGGAHTHWISKYLIGTLVGLIPGANIIGSLVAKPVLAGAITYAIGKLFIKHFENGGWLENFDIEKAKDEFPSVFAEGQQLMKTKISEKL